MKRMFLILCVLVIGLLLVTNGYANYFGKGNNGLCSSDPSTFKKFQKETLPIRDEMISKRFEIRREYQKEKPDLDKIAQLKKEIIDLRTKIHKIADNMGIERECFNRGYNRHFGCGEHNKWRYEHKYKGQW